MSLFRCHKHILLAAIALFLAIGMASAQITSTINGTVRDAQGAVLPGATIMLESPQLRRGQVTEITDDAGNYRVPGLQPGVYQLTAELVGFATTVLTDIELILNANLEIDVVMQVASLEQLVTVSADPPVIRQKQADLQELISTDTIDNIPLNGRQFLDLARLTPATAPRPDSADQGADLTVFGERSVTNSFLVDGLDNNDLFTRDFNEFFIQDAVQEFKLLTGGYEAEFGRAQGAVANVITRSGTDDWHGRVFGFFRNDALDSSNIEGQDAPALERQEVGGTIGGPIVPGKTYFFEAFEFFREERGVNFDQSILPTVIRSGYYTPAFGGQEPFDQAPLDKRVSNFFRLDQVFNEKNQLFFTLNVNRGSNDNFLPDPNRGFSSPPPGTIVLPSISSDLAQDSTSANVRHTGFFSNTTFLESSFRFSRNSFTENVDKPADAEQLFPLTFVEGFTIWMSNASPIASVIRDQDQFQWTENLSYYVNDHSLKFGVDLNRVDLEHEFISSSQIIIGNAIIDTNFETLGYDVSMFRIGAPILDPDTVARNATNNWSFFLQDKWDVVPGLTLNLGIRYDNVSLIDDNNAFAPRVGFAWDVGNRGKTILRSSWGRFYDQGVLEIVARTNELGGVQYGGSTVFPMSRGGAFWNNPDAGAFGAFDPLIAGGTRWLGNPKFYGAVFPDGFEASVGENQIIGLGTPYVIYEMFDIAVADPENPPILAFDTISALTDGRETPASFLAALNAAYPNPTGGEDHFIFLEETGSNSLNTGRPLTFNIQPVSPDGVFELQDDLQLSYTDSFNFGIEQQIGNDISVDAQVFIRRGRDILTRRIANLAPVPVGASCASNTTDGALCRHRLENLGFVDANVFTFSANKRLSSRNSFMLSYSYNDVTDNFSTLRIPPSAQEISFLFSNDTAGDIGRSLNTPEHVFVFNGLLQMPYGINLSGVALAMSGRPFNAAGLPLDSDGDEFFDNRLLGTEKGEFLTDSTFNVDLRLAKEFLLGERAKITGLIEFFNIFNRVNPFKVATGCDDSDGDGAPDPTGCRQTDFANVEPLAGREVQFGVRFDF